MDKDLTSICEEIRAKDNRIMSLTVADTLGNLLAHSYGSEYEQRYMESAAVVRGKASFIATIMMGMEKQYEEVFGKTEAVVRVHENASLFVIPCPSGTKILTILGKNDLTARELLPKIKPVLQGL